MKAFFISRSCCQCGPAISSKPMRGCCCWRKMAWRSGSSVILTGGALNAVERPGGWRQYLVHLRPWTLSGVRLHLAAVYDPAGAGGAGAYSGIVATGLGRSRRSPAADLSLRGAAAGHSRHRRWVDLHLFADASDFIVPQLVGPPGYFIGNMVYSQQGAIGNMPMAAAFTLVPIVLIALYLAFVKRLGAFDAL